MDRTAIVAEPRAEEIPSTDPGLKVGQWYWVRFEKEPWLGCITHVGSNYVEMKGVWRSDRIHMDRLVDCEPVLEGEVERLIKAKIAGLQGEVNGLMGKVRDITAKLAITTNNALPVHSEISALVLRRAEPVDEYKKALVRAYQSRQRAQIPRSG